MNEILIDLSELMDAKVTAPPPKVLQDYVPDFITYFLRKYAPKFMRPAASPLERWCVVQMLRLGAAYSRIEELETASGIIEVLAERDIKKEDLN